MNDIPVHEIHELIEEVRAGLSLPSAAEATAIRRSAGVSQARLAHLLGVTRVTVARWECGMREPRGELRRQYAEVLRVLARETRARRGTLPARLRRLREGHGWTLATLGQLARIQPSRLSAIERRLAVPSDAELTRLCQILAWPAGRAGELLDEVDDGEGPE